MAVLQFGYEVGKRDAPPCNRHGQRFRLGYRAWIEWARVSDPVSTEHRQSVVLVFAVEVMQYFGFLEMHVLRLPLLQRSILHAAVIGIYYVLVRELTLAFSPSCKER